MELNYEIYKIALHTAGTLYVSASFAAGVAQVYETYKEHKRHTTASPSLDTKLTEDSKARDRRVS